MPTKLAIICPVYNEEEVLDSSVAKLRSLLSELQEKGKVADGSYIVFVNDGSTDSSWQKIKDLHDKFNNVKAIGFSCNCGHQQALMAGMISCKNKVDAAITIDVDLQDDISAIEDMLDKFKLGNDVVYGVKTNRDADGVFKRLTAQCFYKLQRAMGIKIVYNHADFRLVSNNVICALSHCNEKNLYLRGIIPSFGFKSDTVEDKISEREAGKSKYTPAKMFKLASDGILSFSSRPLKIITWLGVIFLVVALINAIDVIISLCTNNATPGWSQLMLSV